MAQNPEDTLGGEIREFYDQQKEKHGAWATFSWIGSGIYLFATMQGASFFTWQAITFFFVGTFVAAIVFGIAGYLLTERNRKDSYAHLSSRSLSERCGVGHCMRMGSIYQ